MWQQVFKPSTSHEAIEFLHRHRGSARIIAGGTDLILKLRNREVESPYLVDISSIGELQGIRETKSHVLIGATTTHAEISSSSLIQRNFAVLAQACSEIGSPQIRNTGTLGGNVVNAQPAADAALALVALGAEARIIAVDGDTWVNLADLYLGPGKSLVSSEHALLSQFRIPWQPANSASAYRRLGKCKSVALPVICAACVIGLSEDHTQFANISMAVGPVAPWPLNLQSSEFGVEGKPVSPETIEYMADIARRAAHPRDSLLRCSAGFREEMVAVLAKDVIQRAVSSLQNPGD